MFLGPEFDGLVDSCFSSDDESQPNVSQDTIVGKGTEINLNQEMSIEQGRGVDPANWRGDDNTIRPSLTLDLSAPQTPMSFQSHPPSELPSPPHSELKVDSSSTSKALISFHNGRSGVTDTPYIPHIPISDQSHGLLKPPYQTHPELEVNSLSTSKALILFQTHTSSVTDTPSNPMVDLQNGSPRTPTSVKTQCRIPGQQHTINTTGDRFLDIKGDDPLEASELSLRKESPSPVILKTPANSLHTVNEDTKITDSKAIVSLYAIDNPYPKSRDDVEPNTLPAIVNDRAVGAVRDTSKATVAQTVIESHSASEDLVDCTSHTATDRGIAQESSRLSEQDTHQDSDPIAVENRQAGLQTLQPGEQLSSTTINDVLSCMRPADCYIFDPLFFNGASAHKFSNRFQIEDTITKILVPIHDLQRKHWYLAVVTMTDSTIKIFDSATCSEQSLSHSTRLQALASRIRPQQQVWDVQLAVCPQQPNTYDCGIYTIVNALHLMAQIPPPATYDCAMWRLICRLLLNGEVNDEEINSLKGTFNRSIAEFDVPKPQADRQDEWIIDSVQRAVTLAQKCLKILRTQEAWLQSSYGAACNSFYVLGVLHKLVPTQGKMVDTTSDLESRLESHSNILEPHATTETMERSKSQPEIGMTLSSIQSAQIAISQKAEGKAKSLDGNVERMADAILMGERIKGMWKSSLQQAENERQRYRARMEGWREQFDTSSRQIKQLLAQDKDDNQSERDIYKWALHLRCSLLPLDR